MIVPKLQVSEKIIEADCTIAISKKYKNFNYIGRAVQKI